MPIGSRRWLSRDPIGELGGINLYGYVGNNPMSRVDPFGLRDVDVFIWKQRGTAVGHVMVTEHNSTQVILSQFPALHAMWSYNSTLTYAETIHQEQRQADYVYTVHVDNDAEFNNAAAEEQAMPEWNWNPNEKTQTQCSTAAWNAFGRGGLPFKHVSGTFLPGRMADRLNALIKSGNTSIKLIKESGE